MLTTPPSPSDHTLGPDTAPATLVEYADFQCPSCAMAERAVERLVRKFGPQLRLVFRHFPLYDAHPLGDPAAQLAEYAATEDKFWPAHKALFAHQTQITSLEDLVELAEALGLDPNAARDSITQNRFADRIAADVQSARASGVRGTPAFFLNGERLPSASDYASMEQAITAAISAPPTT